MDYRPVLQRFDRGVPLAEVQHWYNGLVLRSTNWLGDALMTLPAAYKISRMVPEPCGFFVVAPAALAPVWRACPWVNAVIPMQGKHLNSEEIRKVRHLASGVAVVLPNSFGAALDIYRCKIRLRIGRAGHFRSLLLNHTLPEWPRGENVGKCHQLSYYLELASTLGNIHLDSECPPLQVSPDAAAQYCIRKQEKWLALAPGAAFGPAKQWPARHFKRLAQFWQAEGGKIVLVGTRQESAAAAEISSTCPNVLNLVGKSDLDTLMSILANVDAVVANDSGAMHLAAALGTRGVAVFGSTDPVATGPIGVPWRLVVSKAQCRPCFQRRCPLPEAQKYHCLTEITPEEVFANLQALF
ncbi:MAG: lipopolysaccharide heptosyltransferase II [Lentisphaeria bacterium]